MIIENQTFDEERALYGLKDLTVKNCRFDGPADGESAFKECRNIDVAGCFMNLRYPFWHVEKAKIADTNFTENCRAALWYDKDILIENSRLGGIKALRESENISLKNCSVNSPEFAWKSQQLTIENVTNNSEFFNNTISTWLQKTTPEQRKLFTDTIFELFDATNLLTFKEFSNARIKNINAILKSYNSIDEQDKKTLTKMVFEFLSVGRKSAVEMLKHKRTSTKNNRKINERK